MYMHFILTLKVSRGLFGGRFGFYQPLTYYFVEFFNTFPKSHLVLQNFSYSKRNEISAILYNKITLDRKGMQYAIHNYIRLYDVQSYLN